MKPKARKTLGSIYIVLAAFIAVLFAGCSAQPSEGDGKRAILEGIKGGSGGRIKLVSFKKTNGQKGEMLGVQFYSLEYEADIEFTEDCKWVTGLFGQERGFRTVKPAANPQGGFSWNGFLDDTQNPGILVKKGHRETLKGTITFQKTENGWRAAKI